MRVAAYVQARGSIPLLWNQKPNMQYEPPIELNPREEESKAAAQKHIQELKVFYGKLV